MAYGLIGVFAALAILYFIVVIISRIFPKRDETDD